MRFLTTLSNKELKRLEAIQSIRDRRLSVVHAAELLGVSRSQVHRLLQCYDQDGASGLASRKRGRPSNRRHDEDFRNAVHGVDRVPRPAEHHVHRFFKPLVLQKTLPKREHDSIRDEIIGSRSRTSRRTLGAGDRPAARHGNEHGRPRSRNWHLTDI